MFICSIICSSCCCNSSSDLLQIWFFLCYLSFCLSSSVILYLFLAYSVPVFFLPHIILCIDYKLFFVAFPYSLHNSFYPFLDTVLSFFHGTLVAQSVFVVSVNTSITDYHFFHDHSCPLFSLWLASFILPTASFLGKNQKLIL